MDGHYDKEGEPIEMREWAERLLDRKYRQLAMTTVHRRWMVLTEWAGVDLSTTSQGPPLPFSTDLIDLSTSDVERRTVAKYPTEQAARIGHRHMVKQLRGGWQPPRLRRRTKRD